MKWIKINPYCLRSGPWMLAKHGGVPPKYLMTHDARPNVLMWFDTSKAAMDAASALELTPDAPAQSS